MHDHQQMPARDAGYENALLQNDDLKNMSRLCSKITSEITFLQEEHRIFKRPFILQGIDYLEVLSRQGFTRGDDISVYASANSSTNNNNHRDVSC
jgi:hypothetical protein